MIIKALKKEKAKAIKALRQEKDGQFITGKGPGAAYELGFTIVEHFCGKDVANALRKGMICNE